MRTRRSSATAKPSEFTTGLGVDDARKMLAAYSPEVLLLLQLLIEEPDETGPQLMRRLAGHLRLCADVPELAEGAGCELGEMEPDVMRAAAKILSEAARGA